MTTKQHDLLCEALRRFCRFAMLRDSKTVDALTTAWTGLGSARTYRPATDAGLMECATPPLPDNPRHATWWRLTAKGANIVRPWLAAGFTYADIEANKLPPMKTEGDTPHG